MQRTIGLKMFAGALVGVFVLGATLSARLQLPFTTNTSEANQTSVNTPAESQNLLDFVGLSKSLGPAVVSIATKQSVHRVRMSPHPFAEEGPFGEFWKRFFDGPLPENPDTRQGLASGFIVDRKGLILTNNHVVEDAEKIVVRLSDGREFEAKVVGRDPKTDIAVIKIDAGGDLPIAPLGDSDRLEVGERVLAIGNPFGLEHTVTAGIVSAKGRKIGAGPYDNFIQTDASINPGNSGGPLINMRGKVVGINTAIFSRGGGNIGIGFTIPINLVKELLPQLKEDGKVTRGWLGVAIQKVTPEIAESLGLKKARGALVADVSEHSPAEKAELKVGDIIVEFNGTKVKESNDLPAIVALTPVGNEVSVKVLRDGKGVSLAVTIGELSDEQMVATLDGEEELGLTVQAISPQFAEKLGLDRAEGVVITSVKAGSPGHEAGLRSGDVILKMGRKPIRDLTDFRNAVAQAKKNKSVLFLVQRGEGKLFLAMKTG